MPTTHQPKQPSPRDASLPSRTQTPSGAPAAPYAALRALAGRVLAVAVGERDRAVEMSFVRALEAERDRLVEKPPGGERDRAFGELHAVATELNFAVAARGSQLGTALRALPDRVARWAHLPQRSARDELVPTEARGRAGWLAEPRAAPLPPSAAAEPGHPLQRTQARRPRPRPAPPPLLEAGATRVGTRLSALLDPPTADLGLELELGKHRLHPEDVAGCMPLLKDRRSRQLVLARASLLALDNGEVLLVTNMVAQGSYGKLRPGRLLRTGEEVALKEMRRLPSRHHGGKNRLAQDKTVAPTSFRAQQRFDAGVEEEFELMRRFGGRARGLATYRTEKSNFIVMGAMDDDFVSAFERAGPGLRAALLRTYVPALLRHAGAMHAEGYVHLDLKPNNALIHLGAGEVSLADFGSTRRLHGGVVELADNVSSYPPPEAMRIHLAEENISSAFTDSDDEAPRRGRAARTSDAPAPRPVERADGRPPPLRLTAAADVWGLAVSALVLLDADVRGSNPFDYTVFSAPAYIRWHAAVVPNGDVIDPRFLQDSGHSPFTAMVQRAAAVDAELVEILLLGALQPEPTGRPTAVQLAATLEDKLQPTAEQLREVRSALDAQVVDHRRSEKGRLRLALGELRNLLVGRYPQLTRRNFGLS